MSSVTARKPMTNREKQEALLKQVFPIPVADTEIVRAALKAGLMVRLGTHLASDCFRISNHSGKGYRVRLPRSVEGFKEKYAAYPAIVERLDALPTNLQYDQPMKMDVDDFWAFADAIIAAGGVFFIAADDRIWLLANYPKAA
jgi:hypothetical protein